MADKNSMKIWKKSLSKTLWYRMRTLTKMRKRKENSLWGSRAMTTMRFTTICRHSANCLEITHKMVLGISPCCQLSRTPSMEANGWMVPMFLKTICFPRLRTRLKMTTAAKWCPTTEPKHLRRWNSRTLTLILRMCPLREAKRQGIMQEVRPKADTTSNSNNHLRRDITIKWSMSNLVRLTQPSKEILSCSTQTVLSGWWVKTMSLILPSLKTLMVVWELSRLTLLQPPSTETMVMARLQPLIADSITTISNRHWREALTLIRWLQLHQIRIRTSQVSKTQVLAEVWLQVALMLKTLLTEGGELLMDKEVLKLLQTLIPLLHCILDKWRNLRCVFDELSVWE
jgi:hypothetical protein